MSATTTRPYVTFFVGNESFAAEASDISEIFRHPRITRVPGAPSSLLGIAGLRGAPVPVISLARLLGRPENQSEETRLLLLSGEQPIGLSVERVGTLAHLSVAEGAEPTSAFGRLFAMEEAALRVLDLDRLLRSQFAHGVGLRRTRTDAGKVIGEAGQAQGQIALLEFSLADQAYALPLDEVSEVLTLPEQLATIAQSDDAAIGVYDLRGRLLPVVSLRRLLGLSQGATAGGGVIVSRIGDAVVGLAVDRLNAILRVPEDAVDPAPAVLNRGAGDAQVQSICRRPDGGGLVAILSAERLFRDEKVAHILADGRSEVSEMDESAEAEEGDRYLIFRMGDDEYGLPLAAVDEVVRLPDRLTRVPRAPAFVEGVLNLRGKVTPIIDQRRRFEAESLPGETRPRIVVTTIDERQAGFIVDAVSEIVTLAEGQMESTPELTADAGRLFKRVATLEGGERLILLVDPRELLDRAERDLLASMDAGASGRS